MAQQPTVGNFMAGLPAWKSVIVFICLVVTQFTKTAEAYNLLEG